MAKGRVEEVFSSHQRRKVTFWLTDGVTENAHGGRLAGQLGAEFIVKIDDCRAQAGPGEQLFLGGGIRLHAAVIVEMIAREVGENGDVNTHAVHPAFFNTDRAGFQGAGRRAGTTKLGEIAHQRRRFRGGETSFDQGIGKTGTERPDDGAGLWITLGDALADRRLAVGAGNRNQRQPFARMTIDRMGQGAGNWTQILNRQVCCGQRRIPDKIATGLPEYSHGTTGNRIGNITTAVGQIAGIGQKEITGLNLSAIVSNARRLDTQGCQLVKNLAWRNHKRPFPAAASAT